MPDQPKIVSDALAAAQRIAQALSQSGYRADFSLESLKEVDRFFDEQASNGKPKTSGLLSEELGTRLFAIGIYVGEVLRQHVGGEWQGNADDPDAEINIALRLKDGAIVWPVQRDQAIHEWNRRRHLGVRCASCSVVGETARESV